MATSFPQFKHLPLELRRQIWLHTFPAPRRIRRNCWSEGPAALYVNQEARKIAKEFYQLRPPPECRTLAPFSSDLDRRLFYCYGWINLSVERVPNDGEEDLLQKEMTRFIYTNYDGEKDFLLHFLSNMRDCYMIYYPNLEHVEVVIHIYLPIKEDEVPSQKVENEEENNVKPSRLHSLQNFMNTYMQQEIARQALEHKVWQPVSYTISGCSKSTLDEDCWDVDCDSHLLG